MLQLWVSLLQAATVLARKSMPAVLCIMQNSIALTADADAVALSGELAAAVPQRMVAVRTCPRAGVCADLCMLRHLADVFIVFGCVPVQLAAIHSSNRLGGSYVGLAVGQ
jgi:hypothetical protein